MSAYCDSEGVPFDSKQSAIAIDTRKKKKSSIRRECIHPVCKMYIACTWIHIWLYRNRWWKWRKYPTDYIDGMLFITLSFNRLMCDVVKYTKPSICICFRVSWWCRFHLHDLMQYWAWVCIEFVCNLFIIFHTLSDFLFVHTYIATNWLF